MMEAFYIIVHKIFTILIRLRGFFFTINKGLPKGITSPFLGE
jgi:hypothetical protein